MVQKLFHIKAPCQHQNMFSKFLLHTHSRYHSEKLANFTTALLQTSTQVFKTSVLYTRLFLLITNKYYYSIIISSILEQQSLCKQTAAKQQSPNLVFNH